MVVVVGDEAPEGEGEAGDEAEEAEGAEGGAADVIALDELQAAGGGEDGSEKDEGDGFHLRKQTEHQPLSTAQ